MKQERKIKKLILRMGSRNVEFHITDGSAAMLVNGRKYEEFTGQEFAFLYRLMLQRDTSLKRSSLYPLVDAADKKKRIGNIYSALKGKLEICGLEDLIRSGGKGDDFHYCLCAEEIAVEYGEEDEDVFPETCCPGTAIFPPVSKFTGGEDILPDYLPGCQISLTERANLSACIYLDLLKNPSCRSLIVSAVGGGGKTFSLCHAYAQAAEWNIPAFYIRADSLEEEDHNLLHYVARNYLQAQSYHDHVDVLNQFMKESDRPVLFLADGLNECSARKRDLCCASFMQIQKQYPQQAYGVFTTRFPQNLKSRLPGAMEAELRPLPLVKFSGQSQALLSRLHVEATPLIRKLLESMDPKRLEQIQHRYELYTIYFDELISQADSKSFDGWIYHVLASIAARSMEGTVINNRWLKELCSDKSGYDFIHQWCASEEYPLEDPSTAEKLKGTGFLMKVDFDRYVIHQQFRDCLAVRYGILQLECGELSAGQFLDRLIDATRYFRLSDEEDSDAIHLRRHNNMDLGEFGFYALLDWYENHPQDQSLVPKLVQLGIQVAYLYDNVQNWHGLYALHSHLDGLLAKCFGGRLTDDRMLQSLPGYYFCLNKLVSTGHGIQQLSSAAQLLDLSETLQGYYESWLSAAPAGEEIKALAFSGLGGVYLARWRIAGSFQAKMECLGYAAQYHTKAMQLRSETDSPKLYLSYAALGTVNYYKARTNLADPDGTHYKEAANLFTMAADCHHRAVSQESNPEKYVSWTRMAGCFYELYQLACDRADDEEARSFQRKLLTAVRSSADALCASAAKGGAARHGSEIRGLLRDISRYMRLLSLNDTDVCFIDDLCRLYHQAFPHEKPPYRDAENTQIIFI